MRPLVIAYVFGRMRYAPTVDCCNLPLPTGGRFRSLQFAAPDGRTFSQLAICCSQREDGFAACNLPLPTGGRFRSLQFAAPDGRTVSQLAICRSQREDSFAACNSAKLAQSADSTTFRQGKSASGGRFFVLRSDYRAKTNPQEPETGLLRIRFRVRR